MSDLTNTVKAEHIPKQQSTTEKLGLDNPVLWMSGGFIALFVVLALYDNVLLSSIVITAVPVSLILLPSLWNAPQMAIKMAKEQGL